MAGERDGRGGRPSTGREQRSGGGGRPGPDRDQRSSGGARQGFDRDRRGAGGAGGSSPRPRTGTSPRGGADRRTAGTSWSGARRAEPGSQRSAAADDFAGLPRDVQARRAARAAEPDIPSGLDVSMLDRTVRAELRSLSKPNAEVVAGHLVAAGLALDSDPQRALAHARAARNRASRLAAVREAVGIAAYHAGEWNEAVTELRTARRISGDPRNLPIIADSERALGRPAQALKALSDPAVGRLDPETRAELFIVVAGARRDLGQTDAALSVLARGGLDTERPRPGSARLWYAYADALEELGRRDEAARWFAASAALDVEDDTDAAERAAALL